MSHRSWKGVVVAHVGAALVALVVACSGSPDPGTGYGACQTGAKEACTCAGGAAGTATCASGSFGACQCASPADGGSDTGSAPPDAGIDASDFDGSGNHEGGAAKTDAGFGQYMGPCSVTTDCLQGDTCYTFPSKGSFCTHTCTVATDCAAPSPKCTPRGVCAVPD